MITLPAAVLACARTIGRLALAASAVLSAACGTPPTAPSAPAAARAGAHAGPLFTSGYMLSSGRGGK